MFWRGHNGQPLFGLTLPSWQRSHPTFTVILFQGRVDKGSPERASSHWAPVIYCCSIGTAIPPGKWYIPYWRYLNLYLTAVIFTHLPCHTPPLLVIRDLSVPAPRRYEGLLPHIDPAVVLCTQPNREHKDPKYIIDRLQFSCHIIWFQPTRYHDYFIKMAYELNGLNYAGYIEYTIYTLWSLRSNLIQYLHPVWWEYFQTSTLNAYGNNSSPFIADIYLSWCTYWCMNKVRITDHVLPKLLPYNCRCMNDICAAYLE